MKPEDKVGIEMSIKSKSTATYQKNDIVTVAIEDIGSEGEGIGKA